MVDCVCYYCKARFHVSEITRWIENGRTAVCPRCSIDSVLPSELVENDEVLDQLYRKWFDPHNMQYEKQ